jgi:Uma2 family endonuclease
MTPQLLDKTATEQETYVILHGISWEQLEQLDVLLDGTGARLTYLDGILEIMSPLSDEHEESKSTVGLLVEAYMREKNVRFYRRGAPTLGKKEDGTRKEPDESYNLGTRKPTPDLVIEIVVTSGGINKLAVYQRLKVPEVWFWEDGTLTVYCLQESGYEKVTRSKLLPELDLELLAKCSRMADQYDAVKEFTQAIRPSDTGSGNGEQSI